MTELIKLCMGFLAAVLKSRAALQAENLALRHQLCVYRRSVKRPKVKPADRIMWSLLAKAWTGWKDALIFVKPDTVIRWQRKRFKEHWRKLSQSGECIFRPVYLAGAFYPIRNLLSSGLGVRNYRRHALADRL